MKPAGIECTCQWSCEFWQELAGSSCCELNIVTQNMKQITFSPEA
jgi:hypothetical protein